MDPASRSRSPGSVVPPGLLVPRALKSLGDPQLRVLLAGQAVSVTGNWMSLVAISWIALTISGSAFLVGIVWAARTLPFLILSLPAGVAADRVDRRLLIVAASGLSAVVAALTAALTASGQLNAEWLVVLTLGAGAAQAVEVPALHAYIGQIAGPGRVAKAVAMNALVGNAARIIGPGVAGVVFVTYGAPAVFACNALSFLPLIVGLLLMRSRTESPARARGARRIRDALALVATDPRLALLLGLLALNTLLTTGYMVLVPVVAERLGSGPQGAGGLLSAVGVGAVTAAALLAATGERRRDRVLLAAGLMAGAGQVAVATASSVPLALLAYALAGGGMVAFTATSLALIQVITADAVRGRMMSFYAIVIPGVMPLGSLLAGSLADVIGVGAALTIGGVAWLVIVSLAVTRSPSLRSL